MGCCSSSDEKAGCHAPESPGISESKQVLIKVPSDKPGRSFLDRAATSFQKVSSLMRKDRTPSMSLKESSVESFHDKASIRADRPSILGGKGSSIVSDKMSIIDDRTGAASIRPPPPVSIKAAPPPPPAPASVKAASVSLKPRELSIIEAASMRTPSIADGPSSRATSDQATTPVQLFRAKSLVPLTERAVHPLFMDAISQLEIEIPGRPGKVKIGDLLTHEVVKYFVKPITKASGMSLIETLWQVENECADFDTQACQALLDKYKAGVGGVKVAGTGGPKPYVGAVHYFFSHAWSYTFGHLKDMMKQHYETVTGSEYKYIPVFYWVDILAVSQNFEGDFKKHPDGDFPAVIKKSQAVVFTIYPWQEPIAPTRIWCLFEALTAVDFNVSLELQLDARFKTEKGAVLTLEQRFLSTVVKTLDVRNAQATMECDRVQIMQQLGDRDGGVDAFNKLMQAMLKSRMLEALLMRAIAGSGAEGGNKMIEDGATFHHKRLKFKFGRVTDTSLELISKALVGNVSVETLDLCPPSQSKGIISHRGATQLAAALKKNSVLTELDISDNPQLGDIGVVAIAQCLGIVVPAAKGKVNNGGWQAMNKKGAPAPAEKSISELKTLRLSKVGVEDRGITALATMLRGNVSLTSLDISFNSDAPAESLADLFQALHNNKTLKTLVLSGLDFGAASTASFKALPEMLRNNKTLETLCISHCSLDLTSTRKIAEAVGVSGLKVLDATGNRFGALAAAALSDAISVSTTLEELRLRSCDIQVEDAACLRLALAKSGILNVDLSGNEFGKDFWDGLGKGQPKLTATVKLEAPKGVMSPEQLAMSLNAALFKTMEGGMGSTAGGTTKSKNGASVNRSNSFKSSKVGFAEEPMRFKMAAGLNDKSDIESQPSFSSKKSMSSGRKHSLR